jgi:hypothetical protein
LAAARRATTCDAARVSNIESPTPETDDIATADDIAELNRMAVERSAAFARVAGTVVLVLGAFGAAAWLWLNARLQLRLDDVGGPLGSFGEDDGVSILDRLDTLTAYVEVLIVSALAAGVGLGLRAVADYLVARTGGSLTGFRVGDRLAPPPTDLDLEPSERPLA